MQKEHDKEHFCQSPWRCRAHNHPAAVSAALAPYSHTTEAMPGFLMTELILWTSSLGTCWRPSPCLRADSSFNCQLRHLRLCPAVTFPWQQQFRGAPRSGAGQSCPQLQQAQLGTELFLRHDSPPVVVVFTHIWAQRCRSSSAWEKTQ